MSKFKVSRSIILDVVDEIHDELVFALPPNHDPRWVTEKIEPAPDPRSTRNALEHATGTKAP